jgi:hypothetical protein
MPESLAQNSKCRYVKILLFYDFLNWDEYMRLKISKANNRAIHLFIPIPVFSYLYIFEVRGSVLM